MAKKQLITFGRNLGYSIRDMARSHRTFRARRKQFEPLQNSAFVAIAKTPTGGIDALVADTPGSAVCELYKFDSDDDLALTDPVHEETVYNIGGEDVPEDTYIYVTREVLSGRLIHLSVAAEGFYKPLVRFTLAAALATSDASKTATITNQYGPGTASPDTGAGAITVNNLLTHTAGVYLFEGDNGDAGLAMWDSGTSYRIIQMECP